MSTLTDGFARSRPRVSESAELTFVVLVMPGTERLVESWADFDGAQFRGYFVQTPDRTASLNHLDFGDRNDE